MDTERFSVFTIDVWFFLFNFAIWQVTLNKLSLENKKILKKVFESQ